MRKIALLLIIALACAGCQSLPGVRVVETDCARPTPASEDVMVKREPSFLMRLLNFLSPSPPKPTQ